MRLDTLIATVIVSTYLLVGCTSTVRFSNKSPSKRETQKTEFDEKTNLNKELNKWLGTPYKYGGETKNGVDCSALVQNVYESLGINLPRTSNQQYTYTISIPDKQRKPGDLLFFKTGGRINHVGIYIGDDTMVHASSSRGVVKEDINGTIYRRYFASRYVGTGRIPGYQN